MRVLLTGAAGFLGAHCLLALAFGTDWEIVCPVSFRHKGTPERISWAMETDRPNAATQALLHPETARTAFDLGPPGGTVLASAWPRVTVVPCDLAAPVAWTTRKLFGEVDYILNFASLTHPPGSIAEPELFVRNNVELMLSLLEYARTLPDLVRFVHLSTDAVYGPVRTYDNPHIEWSPTAPENPYAASKAAQEALLIAYQASYDVPGLILTTANPIGETQDPQKFVPRALGKLLASEPIPIHIDATGRASRRAYIDAPQVIAGVRYFLDRGRETSTGLPERYNLAGRHELDAREVVDCLAAALAIKAVRLQEIQAPPGYGSRYALDGAKAAHAGWRPEDNAEAALERIAQWSRSHPLWL